MTEMMADNRIAIADLPECTLLNIFRFLSLEDICLGVRLVCRHFRDLTYDMTLWRKLDLSTKADTLTDGDFLHILCQVGSYIEDLTLTGCQNLTDEAFSHDDIVCSNLKFIDISSTRITDAGLHFLVSKYPSLQKLNCLRCKNLACAYSILQHLQNLCHFEDPYQDCIDRPEDTNSGILGIVENNPTLKEIKISCKGLEDETLVDLCKLCVDLAILKIPNCLWISGEGLSHASEFVPNLIVLDISGTPVRDQDLAIITTRCSKLTDVNVSECRKITDIGIAKLVQSCKELRRLTLNESKGYSGNVTDVGLREVARCCNRLEELRMCFCPSVSDIGIRYLSEGCHNLKVLDLTGCLALTDLSVTAIAEHCLKLEKLTASECVQLTSNSVNNLVLSCANLQTLELETCHYLTNLNFSAVPNAVESLPKSLALDETETMPEGYVESNVELASQSVYAIPESNIRPLSLRVLDLSFCSNIALACVKHIAWHCSRLQYLSFRGCYRLNDMAIAIVARSCCELQVLDISGGSALQASRLTDVSLIAIASYCHRLIMLSITKNPLIKTTGVKTVVEGIKTLKRVNLTAGKDLNLAEMIEIVKVARGKCMLQDFNVDYVSDKTKGDFLLKFPPFRFA